MTQISPLAFISSSAKIGNNVRIDAFAYIDEDVVINDGCHIRSNASVLRGVRMGIDNVVYEGAIVGAEPQDFRWKGQPSLLIIGDNNRIREQVIINRGARDGSSTEIGNNTFIMAQTHIGHDSIIGNHCIIGNSCKIAGDCSISDFSTLSSSVIVHEKCKIGEYALIKGGCRVTGYVPPFAVMAYNPISYYGVNDVIMRYYNFTEEAIDNVAKCYRHIYQCNTSLLNAIRRIKEDVEETPEREAILSFAETHKNKLAAIRELDDEE